MESGEENSQVTIDEHERKLLASTGVPPVFAQLLEDKSQTLGTAFAVRAGSIFNRYLMPAAPKPSCVKIKTGNWGFTKGVIAVDPLLGKVENIDGKWLITLRHEQDIPNDPEILSIVTHHIPIQEILSGLHYGEFELVGTESDIQQSDRLIVKANNIAPEDCDIVFSINFQEKQTRVEKQIKIDFDKLLSSTYIY